MAMEKKSENGGTFWESVFVPKEAMSRQFTHNKTGKEFAEIVLPDTLPEGAPEIKGWHFYMPARCVHETKNGSLRISFPPAWTTVRFLSPFVKGKQSDMMEFQMDQGLALLRDTFGNK